MEHITMENQAFTPITLPEDSFRYYHLLQTATFRDANNNEFQIDTENSLGHNDKYGYFPKGNSTNLYTHELLVQVLNGQDEVGKLTLVSRGL